MAGEQTDTATMVGAEDGEPPVGDIKLTPEAKSDIESKLKLAQKGTVHAQETSESADDGKTPDATKDKAPAKPAADTKAAGKRDGKAEDAPAVKLNQRQKEAAKQLGLDDAELQAMGQEKAAKFLDGIAKKHDDAAGEIGRRTRELNEREAALDKAAETSAKESEGNGDGKVSDGADESSSDTGVLDEDGMLDDQKVAASLADARAARAEHATLHEEQAAKYDTAIQDLQDFTEQLVADSFFASLDPKEFPDFGTGPSRQLDADSDEATSRQGVVQAAHDLLTGRAIRGEKVALADLAGAMAMIVAPERNQQIRDDEKAKLNKDIATHRKKSLHGPSRQKTPAVQKDKDAAAIETVTEVGRAKGLPWK